MEFLSSNQFSEVSTIDTIEKLGSRFPEKYENKRRALKTVKTEFDCLGLWIADSFGVRVGISVYAKPFVRLENRINQRHVIIFGRAD